MRLFAILALALSLGGCADKVAGTSRFVMPMGPVGDYNVVVGSVIDRRFQDVIRQRYDFSCGSAALATLLRYDYDFNVGEEDAFRGMWTAGDQAQIRRVGFSLLDMKRWLAAHGLAADGYKVTLDKVAQTGVPGIALIAVKTYKHFVVVKGIRGDEVLLGDPSAGLSLMSRAQFQKAWNGIYFVISNDQDRAKRQFDRTSQWAAYTRAPIGGRFSEPVSQQALMLTNPIQGDF